jgi:hypothetical protein
MDELSPSRCSINGAKLNPSNFFPQVRHVSATESHWVLDGDLILLWDRIDSRFPGACVIARVSWLDLGVRAYLFGMKRILAVVEFAPRVAGDTELTEGLNWNSGIFAVVDNTS